MFGLPAPTAPAAVVEQSAEAAPMEDEDTTRPGPQRMDPGKRHRRWRFRFLRSRSSKRRRGPKRRSQRRRPAPLPQPGHDVLWKLRTAEQHRDDLIRAMSSVQFLWRRLFQRLQAAVSTSILRKGRPGHKSGISVRLRPVADVGAVDARVVLEKPIIYPCTVLIWTPSGVNMHRPANFSSTCRASTLDLGSYRPLGHWFEL